MTRVVSSGPRSLGAFSSSPKVVVDLRSGQIAHSHLSFQVQQGFLAALPLLSLLREPAPPPVAAGAAGAAAAAGWRVAVLGAGGCTLPMCLRQLLPAAQIDAVELHPGVADLATRLFGAVPDERLRLHVEDAHAFMQTAPSEGFDLVILDVHAGHDDEHHLASQQPEQDSVARPLLAPPPHFVEVGWLVGHVARCLAQDGVLALNVVGPSGAVAALCSRLGAIFGSVHVLSMEANVLVFRCKGGGQAATYTARQLAERAELLVLGLVSVLMDEGLLEEGEAWAPEGATTGQAGSRLQRHASESDQGVNASFRKCRSEDLLCWEVC